MNYLFKGGKKIRKKRRKQKPTIRISFFIFILFFSHMRMTAASFRLSAKVTFPEQKLEHQSGWGEPRLAMRLKTRLTVLVLPCDFSGSTAYPEHCLCNSSLPRGEQSPDWCLVIRKVAKVKRWLHGTDSSSPSPCLCFLLLEKGPIRSYRRIIFFFSVK